MKEAVLVILENPNGEVLLLKRNFPPLGWGLPGGKVEDFDESLVDASIREVFEETGISITKNGLIKIDEAVSINGRLLHIFKQKIDILIDPILSDEHSQYKWVNNLYNIEFSGNTLKFFDNYNFKNDL